MGDEDDPTEGDKNDPGEPEHEDVPKQREGHTFEREHRSRWKRDEPPDGTGAGDSDEDSGESKNGSSSDGSSSSEGSE